MVVVGSHVIVPIIQYGVMMRQIYAGRILKKMPMTTMTLALPSLMLYDTVKRWFSAGMMTGDCRTLMNCGPSSEAIHPPRQMESVHLQMVAPGVTCHTRHVQTISHMTALVQVAVTGPRNLPAPATNLIQLRKVIQWSTVRLPWPVTTTSGLALFSLKMVL